MADSVMVPFDPSQMRSFKASEVRHAEYCKLSAALLMYFDGDVGILDQIVQKKIERYG
jgi:hypothetical protein